MFGPQKGASAGTVDQLAIAGTIGEDARINFNHGIDSFSTILKEPCTLPEDISNACDLLTHAAERVMRLILLGQQLNSVSKPQTPKPSSQPAATSH